MTCIALKVISVSGKKTELPSIVTWQEMGGKYHHEVNSLLGELGQSPNTLWCLTGLRTVKVNSEDHLRGGVNSVNIMAVSVLVIFLIAVTQYFIEAT